MHRLILALLAICVISVATPAWAQTYGPNYPVCLQVFGPLNYFECRYTSLPQCAASASGRSAQCVLNPYMANALEVPSGRRHGQRRVY
jgi:hypothetical protein